MSFILSTFSLLIAPFLYSSTSKLKHAREILDGFIFIAIAGLVCIRIMPETIEMGGEMALVFMVVGLVFPIILEYVFKNAHEQAHIAILILALVALGFHAAIDGLALLPDMVHGHDVHEQGLWAELSDNNLALGVILHRLPVGMAIWWSVRGHFGMKTALAVFAIIILSTAASYFSGPELFVLMESPTLSHFQAFVAGSLLHVVVMGVSHEHTGFALEPQPAKAQWPHRLGCTLGLLFIFFFSHGHG